jgi:hypothetical protein
MNTGFWIRRFLAALVSAFVIITGAQLLRERPTEDAIVHGLVWSVISAAVFVAANYSRWRRGQRCVVCGDPPEPSPAPPGGNRP